MPDRSETATASVFLESGAPDPSLAYAVKLPVFEGPLDLLLHLIRLNEVDVADIPITRVAEQYLEYLKMMQVLDLDVAGEYLLMAATLAWIKSRMLLPLETAEGDEEPEDPRAALLARLLEYQRFKEAAETLGEMPRLGRDVFCAVTPRPDLPPDEERGIAVELVDLLRAARTVLEQARARDAIHEVESEALTVSDQIRWVMRRLVQAPSLEFIGLLQDESGSPASRGRIVVTFLAILELARLGALHVFQNVGDRGEPTGPIRVRATGGELAEDWTARISELM